MDITFSPHDLIMAATTLGPVIIGGVGFYVRIQRWHAEYKTSTKANADAIAQTLAQIQALRDELHDTDRDIRGKIGRLHDRVNLCESGLAEVKGWREAQK